MKRFLCYSVLAVALIACNESEPLFSTISVTSTRAEQGKYEECTNLIPPFDAYIYPAYPGTDAWAEFHSHYESIDEIVQALLPSEELAKQLSTESLIHAYIGYPFGHGFQVYQETLDREFSEFSICRELARRNETASSLMKMYERFDINSCDQGPIVNLSFLGIMSVPQIYCQLNEQETKTFIMMVLEKWDLCKSLTDDYGIILTNKFHVAFTLGRILRNANYSPLVEALQKDSLMESFISKWNNPLEINVESIDQIITYAKEYVK